MNSGLWAFGRSSLFRDDAFTKGRRVDHSSAEACLCEVMGRTTGRRPIGAISIAGPPGQDAAG